MLSNAFLSSNCLKLIFIASYYRQLFADNKLKNDIYYLKIFIASYYRQLFADIKMKNYKIKTSF